MAEVNVVSSDNWYVGEDNTLNFVIYQSDGETIQNIAGWTLQWKLVRNRWDTTALISKAIGTGVTITDGPNGACTVTITAANTASLPGRTYYHYLWRTNSGNHSVIGNGYLVLKGAVQPT